MSRKKTSRSAVHMTCGKVVECRCRDAEFPKTDYSVG
jgi:hypothetical protein